MVKSKTATKTSQKKAVVKSPASKTYSAMVTAALVNIKVSKGASFPAIKKYLVKEFGIVANRVALRRALSAFEQVGLRYF